MSKTQWVLTLGLKWPKGDNDYSFATTTQLENARNTTAAPPIFLHGTVFYYHKCPPLSKLNEMINTVLHCISTECPTILVVKYYTDSHWNWTKLFSSCTPVTCYEHTYVWDTGAGIVSTDFIYISLNPLAPNDNYSHHTVRWSENHRKTEVIN